MKSYKLGFTTVTFRQKTPEEICQIARQNNIFHIEWGTDVHVPTPEKAREVRTLCEEYGLETVSLGAYYRLGAPSNPSFSETLEIAEILGADRIRLWLGTKSSFAYTPEERGALINEIAMLMQEAEPYGIQIAFEFHRKTLNDNGESALAVLREIDSPAVSTYWQPFFRETPDAPFPFSDDLQNLLTVLPHISAVHVFSWDEAAHRFPFASHKEAWRTFLSTLRESPCEELILEFVKDDSEAQFAEDLAVLRELLSEETETD